MVQIVTLSSPRWACQKLKYSVSPVVNKYLFRIKDVMVEESEKKDYKLWSTFTNRDTLLGEHVLPFKTRPLYGRAWLLLEAKRMSEMLQSVINMS